MDAQFPGGADEALMARGGIERPGPAHPGQRSGGKIQHSNFDMISPAILHFTGATFFVNLYVLPTGSMQSALAARDSSKVVRGVEPEGVDASSGSLFQATGAEVYNSLFQPGPFGVSGKVKRRYSA